MEITQLWEVKYNVTPTLSKSEEFSGYHFEVTNNNTSITKTYEKTVTLQQDRIKSKLVKREPPQTEINHDSQEIRNILLKRMVFMGVFSEITIDPELSLKNQSELEEMGFRLTTAVISALEMPYSLLDVDNDYLSTTEQFWENGLNGKLEGLDEAVLYISDGIEKSVVEKQPVKSFMMLWVAFNCLYDIFSEKTNLTNTSDTFDKVRKTLGELLDETDTVSLLNNHRNELNALVSYNIVVPKRNGQTKDTPISYQLGRMLEVIAPPEQTLSQAMRCVYEIRNKVFHQGSLNTNVEPQASVAKTLLLPVTTILLRRFVKY